MYGCVAELRRGVKAELGDVETSRGLTSEVTGGRGWRNAREGGGGGTGEVSATRFHPS